MRQSDVPGDRESSDFPVDRLVESGLRSKRMVAAQADYQTVTPDYFNRKQWMTDRKCDDGCVDLSADKFLFKLRHIPVRRKD